MRYDQFGKALQHIQKGEKDEGRKILVELLLDHPDDDVLWLWLHVCFKSKEKKIYCLQRALEINPERIHAREELEKIQASLSGEEQAAFAFDEQNQEAEEQFLKDVTEAVDDQFISSNAEVATGDKGESTADSSQPEFIKQQKEEKRIRFTPKPPRFFSFPKSYENSFDERNIELEKITYRGNIQLHGRRLHIGETLISSYDMPACIELGKFRCSTCTFFSPQTCLLRNDPILLEEARRFIKPYQDGQIQDEKRRRQLIKIIQGELKAHGRPLHYSLLTQMIADRYPRIKPTEKSVLLLMSRRPGLFERVSEGVYRCL